MSLLSVNQLTKVYRQHQGIFDLDLEVEAGDRILVLGPNGAGKTTAFKTILNLVNKDSGQVMIDGQAWDDNPMLAIAKIGAMISKPTLYTYLTGYQNLKLFSKAYPKGASLEPMALLEDLELEAYAHQRVSTYSTGMLQRLDLARALLHQPKLLLLDEPFNGVDIEVKHTMKQILERLQASRPLGILLSSHMAGDLEHFANKVVIIYQGRMLFRGSVSEIHDQGLRLEDFYLQVLSGHREGRFQDASA